MAVVARILSSTQNYRTVQSMETTDINATTVGVDTLHHTGTLTGMVLGILSFVLLCILLIIVLVKTRHNKLTRSVSKQNLVEENRAFVGDEDIKVRYKHEHKAEVTNCNETETRPTRQQKHERKQRF